MPIVISARRPASARAVCQDIPKTGLKTGRISLVAHNFTPLLARRKARPFASLLLAQNEGGTLVYKGNVGTGFSAETLEDLARRMKPLEQKEPPAEVGRAERRGVTFLKPELVAEIELDQVMAGARALLLERSQDPLREIGLQPARLGRRLVRVRENVAGGELGRHHTILA